MQQIIHFAINYSKPEHPWWAYSKRQLFDITYINSGLVPIKNLINTREFVWQNWRARIGLCQITPCNSIIVGLRKVTHASGLKGPRKIVSNGDMQTQPNTFGLWWSAVKSFCPQATLPVASLGAAMMGSNKLFQSGPSGAELRAHRSAPTVRCRATPIS